MLIQKVDKICNIQSINSARIIQITRFERNGCVPMLIKIIDEESNIQGINCSASIGISTQIKDRYFTGLADLGDNR